MLFFDTHQSNVQDIQVKWWIFSISGQTGMAKKKSPYGFGPGTFFGDYRFTLVKKSPSFSKGLRPNKNALD